MLVNVKKDSDLCFAMQESVGTGEIVGSNLEVSSEVASALPRGHSVEAMSARTQVSGLPNDFFEVSITVQVYISCRLKAIWYLLCGVFGHPTNMLPVKSSDSCVFSVFWISVQAELEVADIFGKEGFWPMLFVCLSICFQGCLVGTYNGRRLKD